MSVYYLENSNKRAVLKGTIKLHPILLGQNSVSKWFSVKSLQLAV